MSPFCAAGAGLSVRWCDVMCHRLWPRAGPSELLGIERLIGGSELGDLIECSCHNISNTVYSPLMTRLGHTGHITKNTRQETRGEEGGGEEHFLISGALCVDFSGFTAERHFVEKIHFFPLSFMVSYGLLKVFRVVQTCSVNQSLEAAARAPFTHQLRIECAQIILAFALWNQIKLSLQNK